MSTRTSFVFHSVISASRISHSFSHTVRSSHNSPFSAPIPHSASSLPSISGPTRRGNRKAFVIRLTTNDSMQGNVIASRKRVSACTEASFRKQTHIIERNRPQTLCIFPLRFVWAKTYPDPHDLLSLNDSRTRRCEWPTPVLKQAKPLQA